MQSIQIGSAEYKIGSLTVDKAIAVMELFACINTGKLDADALRASRAALHSVGVEKVGELTLPQLVSGVRQLMQIGAVEWANFGAGLIEEIEAARGVADAIALAIRGADANKA